MVFCNEKTNTTSHQSNKVTILILIDGFLQFRNLLSLKMLLTGHNPYFNRWFSAIMTDENINTSICIVTILILIDGFLQ